MRPISFIIGFLLVLYVAAEALGHTLQYSFEGYIGTGVYLIADRFYSMPSMGLFLDIVYVFTFLAGILMMWIGITGERK